MICCRHLIRVWEGFYRYDGDVNGSWYIQSTVSTLTKWDRCKYRTANIDSSVNHILLDQITNQSPFPKTTFFFSLSLSRLRLFLCAKVSPVPRIAPHVVRRAHHTRFADASTVTPPRPALQREAYTTSGLERLKRAWGAGKYRCFLDRLCVTNRLLMFERGWLEVVELERRSIAEVFDGRNKTIFSPLW